MLRKSLVAAMMLCGLASSTLQAQDNSPINGNKKAWIIRYGTEEGNKRKDLAVMLKLRADGNGKFKGTLVRFDRANGGNYLRMPGSEAKVTISGTYSQPGNPQNLRKPVRLVGGGTIVTPQGKIRVVVLRGLYHPGNDASSRADDRLAVHIKIKNVTGNNGNGNGNGTNADAPEAGVDTIDVAFTEFVAFFQDPCEEEPDTDVLSEETVAGDDAGIDDTDSIPTDP